MATKKKQIKLENRPITTQELKFWLHGILEFQSDSWIPNKEQWEAIKNKIFKTPLPEINKWEQENCYFCTEFASRIYDGNTGSMRTPLQLMELING